MLINDKSLSISQIQASMPFGNLNYFDCIDSTNSWLLKHGDCGDICISEKQSAGRGRRGNKWISPKTGNIYFSICWCFDEIVNHWSLLGLVVGVAIAEALSQIGLYGHGVKWPNDIFWQQKKLGGILLETINQSGKVVIGIGLNISMPDQFSEEIDQKIISLEEAMSEENFSRNEFIDVLIARLHYHLNHFTTLKVEEFIDIWDSWDILQGKVVSFKHQHSEVIGKVIGIDTHGRLGLLMKDDEVNYFSSAEIKIRKPQDG